MKSVSVQAKNIQELDKVLNDLSDKEWLLTTKLVVKPDQLIKRRGKGGLVLLNCDFIEAKNWIRSKFLTTVFVDNVEGVLSKFIIEPFIEHTSAEEHYVCIQSNRHGEDILFYHAGGVDIGDVDSKAEKLFVPIDTLPSDKDLLKLTSKLDSVKRKLLILLKICLMFFINLILLCLKLIQLCLPMGTFIAWI